MALATPSGPADVEVLPYPAATAWRIFIILLFGTFVAIEAASFQSPALSPITRHFDIPVSAAALILLLYYLGATVFAPVMGGLGDQIGRKRMVMIGLAIFAGAEFLAALSPSFSLFLLARFVQGLGVACILPVVLATAGHLFPPDKRGLPLGVMALAMSLGATTGALVAGLLIDRFGWPSIYWVSGSLALLGLILVATLVPDLTIKSPQRGFDWRGTLLLLLTLGGILAAPTLAGNFGAGSWPTLAALALGILSALLLWWSSEGVPYAVIDTGLLRRKAFTLPALIYLLHLLCYAGAVYTLAFILSDRPGGSASQVGFVNLFIYGCSALAAPIGGRLIDRFDPRLILIIALGTTLLALLAFAQIDAYTPLWLIAAIAAVLGLMTGGKTPAIMKIALGTVAPQKMGKGAGLLTMLRDIGVPAGSSFGLAIYGVTVGMQTKNSLLSRAAEAGLGPQWSAALGEALASSGKQMDPALAAELAQRGLSFSDLAQSASVGAISSALPIVGYSLAGVMAIAIVLALCLGLPTITKRVTRAARSAPGP